MWTLPDRRARVHLQAGAHLHQADGCTPVTHRSAMRGRGSPTAVAVVPALAELGRCPGAERLVVALDSARGSALVLDRDLPPLRRALPPGLRRTVDLSTTLADGGLESLVRWRLLQRGVRAVPQHVLGDGRHRDLLVGQRLLIEADGGTHDDPRQHREDMRRDAFATREGYLVLRFGSAQIVDAWRSTEAAIFAVIDRGLHLRPLRA